jgi:hypothetical protein
MTSAPRRRRAGHRARAPCSALDSVPAAWRAVRAERPNSSFSVSTIASAAELAQLTRALADWPVPAKRQRRARDAILARPAVEPGDHHHDRECESGHRVTRMHLSHRLRQLRDEGIGQCADDR